MGTHDPTNKKTKTKIMTKTNTFSEHLQRAILDNVMRTHDVTNKNTMTKTKTMKTTTTKTNAFRDLETIENMNS